MDIELTLKLDRQTIEKAKVYAAEKKLSLSRIVEAYLKSLTSQTMESDFEISPFVKSIATGISLPINIDYKEEYSEYLMEKYK